MTNNDNLLNCRVILEWINNNGTIIRKLQYKIATLKLIRNEFREIFIEVMSTKSSIHKFGVKNISVHTNFMNEGKASIKFQTINCTLFLSNAPPGQLRNFLKTMYVKMHGGNEEKGNIPLRTRLLATKNSYEEISPMAMLEIDKAKRKVTRATDTTPSPSGKKRRLKADAPQGTSSKKLYAESSSTSSREYALNYEQQQVYNACLSGKNVFFTGGAGTGKSHLLRQIIGALPPDTTVVTASTGVAACQIGGTTLHRFAGIGNGDLTLERTLTLAAKPTNATNWRRCKHLIIDEISMIDGDYFAKIEQIARKIRNKPQQPFGGIQLILCGDFLQLPPISREKKKIYCFQTKIWHKSIDLTFELNEVYRQKDQKFIELLNEIRLGQITDLNKQILIDTANQLIEKNGINASRLCSHTKDANEINQQNLNDLDGEKICYQSEDSHSNLDLDQMLNVPKRLELKVGAQVMLLKNIDVSRGLVNGARGVVKTIRDGFPLVQFKQREWLVKHERWMVKDVGGGLIIRKQIPLKLAWAFSIHKSQGLSLDCVEVSLGRVFEAGQAYVALSRAQSLDGLRVHDFKVTQVWADPDVIKFYRNLQYNNDYLRLIPLGSKKDQEIGNKKRKIISIN